MGPVNADQGLAGSCWANVLFPLGLVGRSYHVWFLQQVQDQGAHLRNNNQLTRFCNEVRYIFLFHIFNAQIKLICFGVTIMTYDINFSMRHFYHFGWNFSSVPSNLTYVYNFTETVNNSVQCTCIILILNQWKKFDFFSNKLKLRG